MRDLELRLLKLERAIYESKGNVAKFDSSNFDPLFADFVNACEDNIAVTEFRIKNPMDGLYECYAHLDVNAVIPSYLIETYGVNNAWLEFSNRRHDQIELWFETKTFTFCVYLAEQRSFSADSLARLISRSEKQVRARLAERYGEDNTRLSPENVANALADACTHPNLNTSKFLSKIKTAKQAIARDKAVLVLVGRKFNMSPREAGALIDDEYAAINAAFKRTVADRHWS